MFANYIEINMEEDKLGDRIFAEAKTTDDFYLALSVVAGEKMKDKATTLVFIDEIQAYDHLLTLVKFLMKEGRFTYIASGSLLGVALKNTQSVPVGSLDIEHMYPMDFEEFLYANGVGEVAIGKMRDSFNKQEALSNAMHSKMQDLFKKYILVGGLPKAVETFEGGHNEVYGFQKFITQLYKLPFFIPETESTGTTNILTGWYTINETARLLNKNHYIKDLGDIKVLPINNNGYDHNVTNCTLYLPFVSPINVSYETVLNHSVNVKYDTDLAGGKTTVNIFVDKELYKTIQVSIIENLDLYNIYSDSINGTLSSILNNTLDHCYIRVEYNKPIENLVSYETMEHNELSSYTNFVKTRNASVTCGTQQEQQEIENLLNGGIYIK